MHYQRHRKYGDANVETMRTDLLDRAAKCSQCPDPVGKTGSKGMCRSCYRKTLDPRVANAAVKARRAHTGRKSNEAEREAIRRIYKARPAGYDVDHIIPLTAWGEVVCGLHVRANLRFRPMGENRSAGSTKPPADIAAWLETELSRVHEIAIAARGPRTYTRTAPLATERTCSVEGCTAKHYGSGLCRSHYRKQRRQSGVDHDKA